MSNAQVAAGVTLSIGDALPATYDKAGYEDVTWTEVGEIGNIGGDMGKVFNLATYQLLKDRGIVKRKGGYNNGSITVEYAYHRSDTGQADVVTAVDSDTPLPFRIVMTDDDTTYVYMAAQVMGQPVNIGGTEDFITSSVTLEIDSVSDVLFEEADASP